jgi:Fanconi anemia group M protein
MEYKGGSNLESIAGINRCAAMTMSEEYVSHPLIRPNTIAKRLYQETIIGTAIRWNTLAILPTGVGKTVIAILAAAYQLRKYPESKCMVLAPTKPLVLQHLETFREFMTLPVETLGLLTGEIPPAQRQSLWFKSRILFMTPQALQSDLLAARYTLRDVSLLVVDEAHRATGEYAYVFIADQYLKQAVSPLLLALTASPGSEIERVREIVKNLRIENIELRTRDSPDVARYVAPLQFEWREVELPEKFREVGRALKRAIRLRLQPLRQAGFMGAGDPDRIGVRDILGVQREIQQRIATESPTPRILFQLVSHCAALLRLYHGVEQLETQGISAFHHFLDGLFLEARRGRASRALKELVQDTNVQEAVTLTNELLAAQIEHPKLGAVTQIVAQQLGAVAASRIIVFTHFRETAKLLEAALKTVPNANPVRFVGQASKTDDPGLSQKEQGAILQAFREGTSNILVATSVGEEGLDVQECDLVVFYEAVPSAIRLIQRRGRTGRTHPGRVIVLVALGTRDQGYYWSAIRRENQMKELLKEMSKMSREVARDRKQATLKDFEKPAQLAQQVDRDSEEIRIVVDNREMRSGIAKELKKLGATLQVESLEVGDYILSDRVGVEAKTSSDLAKSIVDRRLFSQLEALSQSFEIPLLMISGSSLYAAGGVNPEAIRGALASAMVDFRAPIINVATLPDAAHLLFAIARREQRERKQTFSLRGSKPAPSMPGFQEYIVASLPGVNTTLARRLLAKFGSVAAIVQATLEDLQTVQGIGKAKAQAIREVLDAPYHQEDSRA